MSGAVWRDDRNGARSRAETLSQGLGGGVSPEFAGPGRYLGSRNPVPSYARRDPKTHPGSEAVDAALRGDQPVVTHDDALHHDAAEVPGQVYGLPDRADVHRDSRTGLAQAIKKVVGGRKQPADQQPAGEVPGEKYPPSGVPGLEVIRDHGGGAQTLPIRSDRAIADLLGHEFFSDGEPSPSAGPVCAYEHCSKILTPAPHSGGGTDNKKYCSAAHRARASEQRKRQAASLS